MNFYDSDDDDAGAVTRMIIVYICNEVSDDGDNCIRYIHKEVEG